MVNLIKNNSLLVAFGIFAALIGMAGVASTIHAQPSTTTVQLGAAATTTLSFLSPTTTLTYQIDNNVFSSGQTANMGSIDSASLFAEFVASSTASSLVVIPQYSNNNIDWFTLGTASSSVSGIGTSTVSVKTAYQWTPGVTATSDIVFQIPIIPAMHERLLLNSPLGGNGAVYIEVDLKKNPSNP